MSLLTIVQDVCDRAGLKRPTVVATSSDLTIRRLFALANEEGRELARRHPWQALTAEKSFITVAQAEQTNTPLPADFDRIVPDTIFNRTTGRKVLGPISGQEWQAVQARPAIGRIYASFRERAGKILMTPSPGAGETVAFEYVSKNWAKNDAGSGKSAFTADDDSAWLDEELIKQGLRWRWRHASGLDYGEDMATYERNVLRAMGQDGGAGALGIGEASDEEDWRANIPETFTVG